MFFYLLAALLWLILVAMLTPIVLYARIEAHGMKIESSFRVGLLNGLVKFTPPVPARPTVMETKRSAPKAGLAKSVRLGWTLVKAMRKRIACRKLDTTISFGTQNAATTAELVGAFYAVSGIAVPGALAYFMVDPANISFEAVPTYNRSHFDGQFHGIFALRPVDIMSVGLLILRESHRRKGG